MFFLHLNIIIYIHKHSFKSMPLSAVGRSIACYETTDTIIEYTFQVLHNHDIK